MTENKTVKYLKVTTLLCRVFEDLESSLGYSVKKKANTVSIIFKFDAEEFIEYNFKRKFFEEYLKPFLDESRKNKS